MMLDADMLPVAMTKEARKLSVRTITGGWVSHRMAAGAHARAADVHTRAAAEEANRGRDAQASKHEEIAAQHEAYAKAHQAVSEGSGEWDEEKHPRDENGKFVS